MAETTRNMQVKTVEGVEYEIYTLPPLQALALKARILKTLLPALGTLVPSGDMAALYDGSLNIQGALAALASSMDERELTDTVETFLKRVKRGGAPISVDVEFNGRTGQMLLVFWACLEVNYADFFAVLKERAGSLAPLLRRAPSPSAGQSGG